MITMTTTEELMLTSMEITNALNHVHNIMDKTCTQEVVKLRDGLFDMRKDVDELLKKHIDPNMASDRLASCKCGSKSLLIIKSIERIPTEHNIYFVKCTKCGLQGIIADSIDEAIEEWNEVMLKIPVWMLLFFNTVGSVSRRKRLIYTEKQDGKEIDETSYLIGYSDAGIAISTYLENILFRMSNSVDEVKFSEEINGEVMGGAWFNNALYR